MKINRIVATHFLGIKKLDVADLKSVVLFHAGNGKGKSCVLNSIRAALLGGIDGVLKKNIDILLHKGESKGMVGIETDNASGDGKFSFKFPSGNGIHIEKNSYLKYSLDTESVLKEKPETIKKIFYDLLSKSGSLTNIAHELAQKGIKPHSIAQFNLSSYDDVIAQCSTKLTENRAAWKAITGENYGSEKAENYEVEEIKFNEVDLKKERDHLSAARSSLEELLKKYSPKKEPRNINELKLTAGNLDVAQKLLSHQLKVLASTEETKSISERLFQETNSSKISLSCIKCGQAHNLVNGSLVPCEDKKSSNLSLDEVKSSLDLAIKVNARSLRDVEISRASIRASEDAILLLKNMILDDSAVSTDKINSDISDSRKIVAELEARVAGLEGISRNKIFNDNKKKKADEYQEKIHELILIAELVKDMKDGELSNLVEPINRRMAVGLCGTIPIIDSEFNITANDGIPLVLLSESEKWKISILLSEAISFYSGNKFMLIDRVDILAPDDRLPFFKWLANLVKSGNIDSIVCAATLRKMEKSPSFMSVFWLENGLSEEVK